MKLLRLDDAVKWADAKVDECHGWILKLQMADCIDPVDWARCNEELARRIRLRDRFQHLNDRATKKHLRKQSDD